MYTQCPSCEAIFALSEDELKLRQGLVRCGYCHEVFNATWNLVDNLHDELAGGDEIKPSPEQNDVGVDDGGAGPMPVAHVPALPAVPPTALDFPSVIDDAPAIEHSATTDETPAVHPSHIESRSVLSPEVSATAHPASVVIDDSGEDAARKLADAEEPLDGTESVHEGERIAAQSDGDRGMVGSTETPLAPGALRISSGAELQPDNIAASAIEEIVLDESGVPWTGEQTQPAASSHVPPEPSTLREARVEKSSRMSAQGAGKTEGKRRRRAPTADREVSRVTKRRTSRHAAGISQSLPTLLVLAAWWVAALGLVGMLVWQIRTVHVDTLAQVNWLRPALSVFCDVVACALPSPIDISRIDLADARVNPHPDVPGALRVNVGLINRAEFSQPFPNIQISLTDRGGIVVGRRAYRPRQYFGNTMTPGKLLTPNVVEVVALDLLQPDTTAVGYEIELVADE